MTAAVKDPRGAGGIERRHPGGPLFWSTTLVGWVVIGLGLRGLFEHRIDTRPANLARFVVGGAILHDLFVAPLVILFGVLVLKVVGGRARSIVQAALVVSGTLALFSYPLIRGFAKATHNPSSLPHNYATNLAVALGIVWAVAAAVLIVRLRRHTDAAAPMQGQPEAEMKADAKGS